MNISDSVVANVAERFSELFSDAAVDDDPTATQFSGNRYIAKLITMTLTLHAQVVARACAEVPIYQTMLHAQPLNILKHVTKRQPVNNPPNVGFKTADSIMEQDKKPDLAAFFAAHPRLGSNNHLGNPAPVEQDPPAMDYEALLNGLVEPKAPAASPHNAKEPATGTTASPDLASDLSAVLAEAFFHRPLEETKKTLDRNGGILNLTQSGFMVSSLSFSHLFVHQDPVFLEAWCRANPESSFAKLMNLEANKHIQQANGAAPAAASETLLPSPIPMDKTKPAEDRKLAQRNVANLFAAQRNFMTPPLPRGFVSWFCWKCGI